MTHAHSNGTIPTPYGLLFPQDWGFASPQNFNRYYLRNGLRTSSLAGTFTGSIRTKAHYKFWRKGKGKATNLKFCTHIHRNDRNKSPLKISGKVAVGVLRDSRKLSGHHTGASHGHPCDSSVLFITATKIL